MRYWWVNQNQTFRHEFAGGYLWSPKRNRNGAMNPFYEFMREVAPGDVIFSFSDTRITAMGRAASHAYEAPKPLEFGQTGAYWDQIGWRVDVRFTRVENSIRPVEHIARIGPYLAEKYAPLQQNGNGLQGVYLTHLSDLLAGQLIDLIGTEARAFIRSWTASEPQKQTLTGQLEWEEHQLEAILQDTRITETDRKAIVIARRGQGLFRARVAQIERRCRVTGVTDPELLRASHTKPWRQATNEERLDGENGFLLTPDVDVLFDRGFITFENSGKVLVSPVANKEAIAQMGIGSYMLKNVGPFASGQRKFLDFHRENVFLEARIKRPT